jgi:menaquinone-dependent protoporphyrinogen oxidase
MADILILYASKHGQTQKIATRIARALEADGVTTRLHDAASRAERTPHDHDAVIVGASIHAGHHQREIVEWAKAHRTTLNTMPSAFFSACLTAADDTDESREATRRYIDEFLDATGWIPRKTSTFAGALQYREYDFATRLLMRLLMRKGGHPTDAGQDYDYTDWDAVDHFAHECAGMVAAEPVGRGSQDQ